MSVEPELLMFAVVVFAGYAVQTVAGFGSMLVCVTLGAHLIGIRELVTLAVPLSLLQTGYITIRHRDGVDQKLLFMRVLPLMGLGTVIAAVAFSGFEGAWLRYAFAVMILVLAARELYKMRWGAGLDAPPPKAASFAAIFGAGLIHGIYATGGPLLVYAIGREGLDKHRFRSTLSAVWLALGIVLLVTFVIEGRYDASTGMDILVLLPAAPLGILVGEKLHHRVDEKRFKAGIWILLIVAAASLLLR